MYTNIPKPSGASYTNVRNGSPLFDDSTVSYDDLSIFYDGSNSSSYININKPIGLTWNQETVSWNNVLGTWDNAVGYTNINKPNG